MTAVLISSALQLTIPSYALRLVRRFGVQRTGWFIVKVFSCFALLHLLGPLRPVAAGPFSGVMPEVIYSVGSLLLLIGMGHMETLFSEREQAYGHEQKLCSQWELQAKKETADLARANRDLRSLLAGYAESEIALKESEARYRFLFDENPQPMCIFDTSSCQFLAANHAALLQYGFTQKEFLALTARDLVRDAAVSEFVRDVNKPCRGAESRGFWQHCRKDRTLIDVEITAMDIKYAGSQARLILPTDVSQRRRRELESQQVSKMEVIGRVAGGVAHHFNNILTIVDGNVSILLHKPQDPTSAAQLKHVSDAVVRATTLTRQLIAAGGLQQAQVKPVDLNGLIRNLSEMLRRLVGVQIVLNSTCSSSLSAVLADRRLLEHIIVHLVLNARDAMPEGGLLTISTAAVSLGETQTRGSHQGKAGDFVRLTVRDTGCGMSPETQARLFEPFFTTKDVGQAVGLGLASVHGAIKQMSGWIEFNSTVGAGSEFRVFLPCAPVAEGLAPAGSGAANSAIMGTVLLVASEDRVRNLARCVLSWNAYRVIEADCSATALMLWQGQASKIDLLLTDATLPDGMAGRDLANRLRETSPQLKVVYLSNPNPDAESPTALLPEQADFIPKPFSPARLLLVVQRCLAKS